MAKVVVIGAGTMGVGIAAGFLAHGTDTVVLGRDQTKYESLSQAIQTCASSVHSQWPELGGKLMIGNIDQWNDWTDTQCVIETVSERLDLKKAIFADLDHRVPTHIPIGSNSSGFPISAIAGDLPSAHRMFNTHYFMPAHIVPLVEIVMGERSDPALAQALCDLYRAHHKKPVLVKKDIPGFLANRIQHALMREALSLIENGIATPDDVDAAVRYSFGFRYAAVGPITQKEISGWEGMTLAAELIYPSLSNITAPPPCVTNLIKSGKTGIAKGAGFKEWPPKAAAKVKQQYEERLKAAFDVLQLGPDEDPT
jgi:3-hydroxybutyryl-CoA dehydrogenase